MQIHKYDIHKHANTQIENQIPGSSLDLEWTPAELSGLGLGSQRRCRHEPNSMEALFAGKKNWTEMMGRKLKKFVESLVPGPPSSPIESLLWRIEGMEPWPRLHQCIAMCCYIMCCAHPENTMQCIAMRSNIRCCTSRRCAYLENTMQCTREHVVLHKCFAMYYWTAIQFYIS